MNNWWTPFICTAMLICLVFGSSRAQGTPPDWHMPVKHPIKLSGTYGELRGAHFHHGIDIKSARGSVGDPMYAIGEGDIVRIKVTFSGYGQAIYIRHPEGYMSVYAHMEDLMPEVAKRVFDAQVASRSYEVDLELAPGELPVKRGQKIGTMGNTGYSFGPHLHFELRDRDGEHTLNPLDHGFRITDGVSPQILGMKWQRINRLGIVLDQGRLPIDGRTVSLAPGFYAFSVRTFDKMKDTYNRNGVDRLTLHANGQEMFAFDTDTIGFSAGRLSDMLKTVEDVRQRRNWYRLHTLPCAQDPYHTYASKDLGWIEIGEGDTVQLAVHAYDWEQNVSSREVLVIGSRSRTAAAFGPTYHYALPCGVENHLELPTVGIHADDSAFFREQWLFIDQIEDAALGFKSTITHIQGDPLGYQQGVRLTYDLSQVDSAYWHRLVVVRCDADLIVVGGERSADRLEATIYKQGKYALYLDTIAPTAKAISFPDQCVRGQTILISLEDDIEPKGDARDVLFDAYLDGAWIPVRYDLTKYRLVHKLNNISSGTHRFELRYKDHAGNTGNWQKTFFIR